MVRVIVYVALLALLFCGAVLWAGNAMGSWEPATVPARGITTKAPKHHGKHHGNRHHAPKSGKKH